jgi:hypothetical protein
MAQIRVRRETLADMLRSHGEDNLAERALSLTDVELTRIQELGAYDAWSEQALALHGSMGAARALSLATIDVLENTGRDLHWTRTKGELEMAPTAENGTSRRPAPWRCPSRNAARKLPTRPNRSAPVSIELLEIAADALGEPRERVVFLAGATIGVWMTDPAAPATAPTAHVRRPATAC